MLRKIKYNVDFSESKKKSLERLKAAHSEVACQINFPCVAFDGPGEDF